MRIITNEQLLSVFPPNEKVIEIARQAFINKEKSILPPKTSIGFNDGKNFFTTMPVVIPKLDISGVKIVSRYPTRHPSIRGDLLLYRYSDGEPLAIMDATLITTKRTGAIAALAVETLAKHNFSTISLIGLGQTGKCFLDMFLTNSNNRQKLIKLKSYKEHALLVQRELKVKGVKNVEICDTNKKLIQDSDVIVSAITVADGLIGEDSWFQEGCLVVPIHTRGFQNCDLFFDKVFADDTGHVKSFKYFDKFKQFYEIDAVLKGEINGRESETERILSYNIGIALQDVYLASYIYNKLK